MAQIFNIVLTMPLKFLSILKPYLCLYASSRDHQILIKASSKIGLLESDPNPPQLKSSRQEGHSHYKN